ncbi:uncharacterized protein LOC127750713 [Frankliniella occidentalis]|uniref:Uncharacterized protein LOC127750713 n=1 Tax=Frankliniella occidentalis TaxID=133901 RepID=A0A9C6XS35_FRAOC|nr:uncharacterized protein LOC127750713 [Frankliniella occidentalis]
MEGCVPFFMSHSGPTTRNSRVTANFMRYPWLIRKPTVGWEEKRKLLAGRQAYRRNLRYRAPAKKLYSTFRKTKKRRQPKHRQPKLEAGDSPYTEKTRSLRQSLKKNFECKRRLEEPNAAGAASPTTSLSEEFPPQPLREAVLFFAVQKTLLLRAPPLKICCHVITVPLLGVS